MASTTTLKERLYCHINTLNTKTGKIIDLVIVFLILILCISYILCTFSIPKYIADTIHYIELIIGGIFVIEYIIRFWVAGNKLKHFFNIYSIIDLVSIIPFIFTFANLQFIRIFRVFRILRLLRFLKDEHLFFGSIREDNLVIVRIIFTILSIIFVGSGLIFYEEYGATGSNINNFFDAIYFTIVTLTTVGFGDITPITTGGKLITILMILSGVIFLPWQIATLIRKFVYTFNKKEVICKSCGLKYHEKDAIHCRACGQLIYQEYNGGVD